MSMMGSSSEDDTSKAHKGNTISGNDKQQKPQVESEQVMTNGTGSEHTSDVESVSEESKRRNITEITKIIELPQKIDQSATDNSLSADYQFLGFESVSLSNDQNRNLEAFHRVLDEFNIPYDKKETLGKEKEDSESEKKEESDEEKEEDKKSDEDMTVDAAIVVSDSDSDQMEIDMDNNDKDSSRAIDSDIESVKGVRYVVPYTKGSENVDLKKGNENIATDSKTTPNNIKGDMAKVEYCGTCSAEVDDAEEGIFCDGRCERWFHLRCSGLSRGEYDELSMDENAKWACSKCSGKPIQPAAGSKPLLSVRKDLGQISTPPLKRRSMNKEGRTPKVDIANPAFLKPFDFGWKRELVYRSTNDNQNRRQGDVYYYTAQGKKLRSLREISDYLAGTDLTIDNFTFWKEPLGIEDSQKEIIRDAKLKLINKDQDGAPSPKQKLLTPKTPKTPKVTPKLIATVSPEDLPVTLKVPASVTPRVVLKKPIGSVGAKFKATLTKSTPVQPQNKEKKKKSASDDELEMGMLPPMWDPNPKPKENSTGTKRPLEDLGESPPESKRPKVDNFVAPSPVMQNFMQNISYAYKALLISFQYLKVQELLRASRVSHMWRDLALHKDLWEVVRMKNSHVKDWEGFSATLRKVGTKHLDLRKILMPDKPEALKLMWTDCVKALSKVNTLVKLDLGRSAPSVLEQIASVCPQLENIAAVAIKTNKAPLNLTSIGNCQNLTDLRIKSQGGVELINVNALANLTKLKQLSLTTVTNINAVLEAVCTLTQLECLEIGDCVAMDEQNLRQSLSQLTKLRRLRLEKGQEGCPTEAILNTISNLPNLNQLELINFDIKVGFDEALAHCSNIKALLIIPTYVTQSATTNHLVIEGVNKLSKTLNHFVWGLTVELLRVTDLFIDQWEMGHKKSPQQSPTPKKSQGDSIPILKPGKDGSKAADGAVTQVDVLQLPKLHKVLTTLLPNTKIIILKVPFSATWRQTISNTSQ